MVKIQQPAAGRQQPDGDRRGDGPGRTERPGFSRDDAGRRLPAVSPIPAASRFTASAWWMGTFVPGFKTELHAKDARIVDQMAAQTGTPIRPSKSPARRLTGWSRVAAASSTTRP